MSKKGFKGFNKDLKCRNFQFSENAEFSQDGDPVPCKSGFHYCENPLDVFKYYPPNGDNVYATVEARGVVVQEDHKSVTNKIYVGKRISLSKMFKLCFKVIASLCETSVDANTSACASHANTSGDRSHANTSGGRSHANTSGYESHANTSGGRSHANTSGYESHANTSGYASHANTSGDESHANTSGYASHANTSGDESHANTSGYASHANTSGNRSHAIAKGKSSIACALGNKSKVMCSKSGLIVLLKYNDKGQPIGGVVAKVGDVIDGVEIKPNVFYYFDGEKLTCDKR